jgi:hypothetical protein
MINSYNNPYIQIIKTAACKKKAEARKNDFRNLVIEY